MRFAVLPLACALATPALADPVPCTDIARAQAILAEQLQEHPIAAGMAAETALVLLANDEGAFTLLAVGADGTACIAAMGHGWRTLARTTPTESAR